MAITIQGTPPDAASVHGDLIYTVAEVVHTADPVTYPNYKFVGDVYIGATLVARIKKVPDPITKIGIFNIGQIVRNYIAVTFNPAANNILAQTLASGEFYISVTMKFGEEYSFTMFTDLVTDDLRVFFNNYNSRGSQSGLISLIGQPLTDRPLITPVRCDSSFNFIPYWPATEDEIDILIRSYDYSNSEVNDFNFNTTPDSTADLLSINLSKDAINAQSADFINGTIKYYTAEFNENGIIYQFNRECECTYEVFTLHFLNKYGGFESKDFAKVSRKTISIEKKDFGKLPYTVDSSGVVSYKSANNVYNESRSVYSSQFKEKMTLNSDFLTDAEYTWLEQLVLSPMVYMEEDGNFFPVVITETNYEPKKVINDELTNLTLNIEFGEQLNAQFR